LEMGNAVDFLLQRCYYKASLIIWFLRGVKVMSINKDTINQVAHLARIALELTELDIFSQQLKDVIGFIDTLKKLDIQEIEPTSHILPVKNISRNDEPKDSLSADTALQSAPNRQGDFFGVPQVIE
jgi:aspartyl-tRNA(Asn)/glutamyl-tRNA(Gln) amidotransferase subunit C